MSHTKRQYLPNGLWMVATPIGNLADLSLRAQWAFTDADEILCEDTRRTATLLSALGLGQKIASLHRLDAHSTLPHIQHWVSLLQEGKNLLFVSDAGTPAVSDPGSQLVALAHAHGVRVTPVPGPSAPLTLISCAGFESGEFTFRGFFPRKKSDQAQELKSVSQSRVSRIFIWFESPQRIQEALESLVVFNPELRVVVGKELTKLHERVFVGSAHEVRDQVSTELSEQGELGEWCFAVEFEKEKDATPQETSVQESARLALQCLLDCQVSPSGAVKKVSQIFGVSKNEFYALALELSGKK
jgi:16S rRNA (cytidine1402-2'-O)-methyltransferase